jgi:PAS domain S-box-containing protein
VPADPDTAEIKRLQRCINDLVSVMALQSTWVGAEPRQILATVVDALHQVLDPDFTYMRVVDPITGAAVETLRGASAPDDFRPGAVASMIALGSDPARRQTHAPSPFGGRDVALAVAQLGLQGDLGLILVGSQRADFPRQTERLLLDVAANQAVTGLQEACLLRAQKRVSEELDERVAQRTAELADAIQALSAREAELQIQVGLLQQLPVSAWTLKPDGTPDFVNQVWLDFSGQSLDYIRSHPEAWMAAIHPEDREAAARTLWEGVRARKGFAFESRSLRAGDGTYRRHLQQAVVLRDADGQVLRFVGTTTDIDDQKRAEETLRQVQADLAHVARVATLNAMTASIAHEVRQPLSGILTNASTGARMLAADPPNLAGAAETIQRTIRDANRASEVLKRLREMFSKKETASEPLDLNSAARDVIALSAGELERSATRLRTEFANDLPPIRGDRVQLQQVILNLLLNAAEAMAAIEDRPRDIVVYTGVHDGGHVELGVRDSGTGLDHIVVEKLFETFYTTKPNGMGVGLSICRSIIESHNGRLWATPNDGPGATFSFSIPRASLV